MKIDNHHITPSSNNIKIEDSYCIRKKYFNRFLNRIKILYPNNNVIKHRKLVSLKFEWAVHNFIYGFAEFFELDNIMNRCKDVDLNWPQKWYVNWTYNILGVIIWIFVK